jgi:hypothetical protein
MNVPQFMTRNTNEIEIAREKLSNINLHKHSEIWHLHKKHNPNSFWGRQYIHFGELFPCIVPASVELLNRSSGRILNQYPNIPDGYIRMEKDDRPYPFEIVEKIANSQDGQKLVDNAKQIGEKLNKHQKRIIELGTFLQALGSRNMSIDFTATENEITFLDIDTGNDNKIFSLMEQKGV